MKSVLRKLVAAGLACTSLLAWHATNAQEHSSWHRTWQVGAQITPRTFNSPQTVRHILRTSIGGNAARIRLSNDYGNAPVTIANVRIALPTGSSSIDPRTDRQVTFNGQTSITIPARAHVVSDAVSFNVPALGDVAISLYVPNPVSQVTGHQFAWQNNFLAAGDVSAAQNFPARESAAEYYFLEGLDVVNTQATGTLVVLGASLTDGYSSDFGANNRWANDLAIRFAKAGIVVGVANAGMSGNGLIQNGIGTSAAERFDNQVLSVPGVRWVDVSDLLLNDLNSLTPSPAAGAFLAELRQLRERAHEHGVQIICSTLTPYKGANGYSEQREAVRQAINAGIRENQNLCDFNRDADLAVRDPNDVAAIAPKFNADNIHPNAAGYQAIADAIPLTPFQQSQAPSFPRVVGTFGFAPEPVNGASFAQQTIRTVARTSIGGSAVRIEISNTHGSRPLVIGEARVALSAGRAAIVAGSDRRITFNNGDTTYQVPPGGKAISDLIEFAVPASTDLAVSLYFPNRTNEVTGHNFGNQDSYIASGNTTASLAMENASPSSQLYFLSHVSVVNPDAGTLSVFGGSLADGWGYTFGTRGWPQLLARRLNDAGIPLGVNHQGSVGNRMINDSFARNVVSRVNRDALAQPGSEWLLLAEAPLNDIAGEGASFEQLKAALHQVLQQAHDANVKVMCATLTPYNGFPPYNAAGEAARTAYNDFIRGGSSGCDTTMDADAAVRSPEDPTRLRADFDLGNHIDVNDAGAAALANAVDLSLLQ